MAREVHFGKIDVQLSSGGAGSPVQRKDTPFRMLVIGDFGGNPRPSEWRTTRVDRDNFDNLPGRFSTEIELAGFGAGGGALKLPVASIDDFRPDRLLRQVGPIDQLRDLRERLNNPRSFDSAAQEILSRVGGNATVPPPPPPPASGASLLEQMLGGPLEPIAPSRSSDWEMFLRRAVGPHLAPIADPRQMELTRTVNAAITGQLRAILKLPRFREIEAAWRGLGLLIKRLDTDTAVHLHVLDLSKAELAQDLAANEDLTKSKTYDQLIRKTANTEPWTLIVGAYQFVPNINDVEILGRLAMITNLVGTAFVAGADPSFVGCSSFLDQADPDDWTQPIPPEGQQAWSLLRRLPETARIALAMPNVLMRQPYGREGAEVEGFSFEELNPTSKTSDLPWGHAAFAWATLLGEAFARAGWRLTPDLEYEIRNLPVAYIERYGEKEAITVEGFISDRAADRILAAGLAPVRAVMGSDRVQFPSMNSIAHPTRPLQGRWA